MPHQHRGHRATRTGRGDLQRERLRIAHDPGVDRAVLQQDHLPGGTRFATNPWAQLVSVSKTLTNSSHYGIGFAAQPTNGNAAWQFEPFLWSNGGHFYNLSATPAVQALALWTNLVKDGSAPKDVVNWTQTTVEEEFAAGREDMMVNGPWNLPALNSIKGLNYGAVSIPTRVAGQTVIAPIGGEVWTIPKTNPAAEQATCGVLKYMETPSVVVYDATTNWEIPVIKTAFGQAEKVKEQGGHLLPGGAARPGQDEEPR